MESCLFCKIINRELRSFPVHEDESSFAFLDINPVNRGHTLLVPKKHFRNLYDLDDETLKALSVTLRILSVAVKKAVQADGINIEMNNERPAGQIIDHAHFHIVPRFSEDGLRHWPGKKLSDDEMQQTAEYIKKSLA